MQLFDEILQKADSDIALFIGNGIHRYSLHSGSSWDDLLLDLAHQNGLDFLSLPQGASATEFFDVLELKAGSKSGQLSKAFCQPMQRWQPSDHHRLIMRWARRHQTPVLTTNFDEVLSKAAGVTLCRSNIRPFTDFYPWDSRYADTPVDNPCVGFGIWHVNGMARYARSIRLSLSHYMGSTQRARDWFHRGPNRLFAADDPEKWAGRHTWLHIIFNKSLLIFGLGLAENEVFIRWLLIERARYFAKFPNRKKEAWYVSIHDDADVTVHGRQFFLEGVGVKVLNLSNYSEIYETEAWNG